MKYITYKTHEFDDPREACLINETERFVYLCDISCYEWLKQTNHLLWLPDMNVKKIPKHMFHYQEIDTYTLFYEPWVYQFPLEENDRFSFSFILEFFDYFFIYQHLSLESRIEHTLDHLSSSFPSSLLHRLVSFVALTFKDEPIESFRIQSYLTKNQQMTNKYIHYYDSHSNDVYTAFLAKEDEQFFYLCEPLIHEWLHRLDKQEWFHHITYQKMDKQAFFYQETSFKPSWEEWMFTFPLLEEDLRYIKGIVYFFETFFNYHEFPFIKRIEICLRHKRYPITEDLRSRIIQFIGQQFKQEKVRMIFCDKIRPYLK